MTRDDGFLASLSECGEVRVWNCVSLTSGNTGSLTFTQAFDTEGRATSLCAFDNARSFIAGNDSGEISVLDTAGDSLRKFFTFREDDASGSILDISHFWIRMLITRLLCNSMR